MITDTIAAIATATGEGSIAIIRVSGIHSISLCETIFHCKTPLSRADTHTVHYGHIIDPKTAQKIDEVLVTLMKSPRSFTAENVVEINCHGGTVAAQRILRVLLDLGIRLAEPGEFTKRAFLNGRIDLSQAEAVIDLIRAKTDRAFRIASKQSTGFLSEQIRNLRQKLLQLIAHLEVNIDYPEHDTPELTSSYITEECTHDMILIDQLLASSQRGKILREGIVTAIIGRPNVGKSSLLNALLKENRAIVTEIPGTTRDVIEEFIHVNGIPLRLLDTAGIRETDDLVEQIGVEKSRVALQDADLIFLVLNNNEELTDSEREILNFANDKPLIFIINKTDLPNKLDINQIRRHLGNQQRIVLLSVRENEGFDTLDHAISELFLAGHVESDDLTYVSNVRHIHLLEKARSSLQDAVEATINGFPIDIVQIDLRDAWETLGEIIGDSVAESLLDQIFSQFCLGK